MSLINDALKRTQQTTRSQEPPRLDELELPPLEPIEPAQQSDGSGAKRILWIIVLLVVAMNVALWLVFKDRDAEAQVAARTAGAELVEPEAPAPEPEPVAAVVVEKPAIPTPAQPVSAVEPAIEAPVEAVPVIIEHPTFKLKTIVSHPVRPSAMINNRVLFVGDRVEGYTVMAISQDNVTLNKNGDEVVVSLP